MLIKTKGIALSYIKYKESSIIVKIFTRELGLKSYIVNGVRSKGSQSKIAFYQPLSLLDLVVYDKKSAGLQRLSETKMLYTPSQIPFDFTRMGISLFITEVITKSIYEDYQNESLFDFLHQSILHLDGIRLKSGHFPLIFMANQAKYLGFSPERGRGFFSESLGQPFIAEELDQVIDFLDDALRSGFGSTQTLSKKTRQTLLEHLLEFYSFQLGHEIVWKTMPILRQLMN